MPPAPLADASSSLAPSPADAIPAAMLGRWGLVAADCEPGRDDAKGLMTVEAAHLRFYESIGTLDDDIDELSATRIRADFDFTGEGMTWDREMTLELQDGGRTLVRQEYGDDAMAGPLRYSKCS
ncbi:MAG: hypothetical protein B7Z08_04060 [Sphingomonadales bacterium 32-68-7]|nr:MAG: hypothetical protein B7Z33_13755 [Sphingomonadales bacterium 12-68-11]OYX09742.1 MAG: hypothetical protein B7Z08_04060 [Sphingomonadales bacterium 32-68-7]